MNAAQWQQLARVIECGARAAGFDTERWTLRRIAVRLVMKLIGLTLFVAVIILCLVALLTHGMFI